MASLAYDALSQHAIDALYGTPAEYDVQFYGYVGAQYEFIQSQNQYAGNVTSDYGIH